MFFITKQYHDVGEAAWVILKVKVYPSFSVKFVGIYIQPLTNQGIISP